MPAWVVWPILGVWEVSVFPSAPTDGHVHVLCVRALVQNMQRQMDVQMRLYSGSKKSALEREKKTQSVKSIYFVIVASVHQTVNLQGLPSKRWLGRYRHGFTFRAESEERRRWIFKPQDREKEGHLSRPVWHAPGEEVWKCEISRGSEGRWKRSQVHLHLDPKLSHIIGCKWCPPLILRDSEKVGEIRK